jgi:hypothetical protein
MPCSLQLLMLMVALSMDLLRLLFARPGVRVQLCTCCLCQDDYGYHPLIDELLCAVGAGTCSCANACAIARSCVYGATDSVAKSVVQIAKCGTWGENLQNVERS